ncbi:MAG TPA: NIPSNAP family protein [Terriglobia bacterium]|nr:NIPSNAP family protein [Terriglobia bacterium]
MNRRRFVQTALAGGTVAGGQMNTSRNQENSSYVVLGWFRCRRDFEVERLRDFLRDSTLPALGRAGVKPVGVFEVTVGPDNPSILLVETYRSMVMLEETANMLASDEKWMREMKAFDDKWDLSYERGEASLLRTFKTFPGVEVPQVDSGNSNLFELRVYESRNRLALEKKIAMFEGGEISIFKRVGLNPVFFGRTVFGQRMPNLAYMVSFPSWAARAEAWAKFSQDQQWQVLSKAPGNTDRELVSRISNQLMTPTPFSQIR